MKVKIGGYNALFLIALAMAFIGALIVNVADQPWWFYVSIVVGLVLGIANITEKESLSFSVAYIGLTIVSASLVAVPMVGGYINAFFTQMLAIFGFSALIVFLKTLMKTSKNK